MSILPHNILWLRSSLDCNSFFIDFNIR